jgi:hypothetical protein
MEALPWIQCGSDEWHGVRGLAISFAVLYLIFVPVSTLIVVLLPK